MSVMIGIDPHKASHAAVAVDGTEQVVGTLRVRATPNQTNRLRDWADSFGERTWAVEAARGLGLLVAQQLVAAGETVLDVPPTLAARARVLDTGSSDKTDDHDARSVAICAMRNRRIQQVTRTDDTRILALAAKRHRNMSRHKTVQANRLQALFLEMIPGGNPGKIRQKATAALLERIEADGDVDLCRLEIAWELYDEIEDLRLKLKASTRRLDHLLVAHGTTLTDITGVGPLVAATILGAVGDPARFPTPGAFARFNGTAPIEASSADRVRHRLNPYGNRRVNWALHIAAVNQLRYPGLGRSYYDRRLDDGKNPKEALRCLKRQLSNVAWRHLRNDARRHTS